MVYEERESPAAFEAFSAHLMPILQDVGINLGVPNVSDAHNMIG